MTNSVKWSSHSRESGNQATLDPRLMISGMILFALFFLFPASLLASNNFSKDIVTKRSAPLAVPSQEIRLGEHLLYDVYWMGVYIGKGELWVKEKTTLEGRDCFHIVAVAETNDFLTAIYPVHDEVHTWIDAENFQSLQFQKKVSEGRYRAEERVRYDASAGKGHYESLKNGSKKEFDVQPPVQDILSAFYWARRQIYSQGQSAHILVNSDEKDWDLSVQMLDRQTKEVRGSGEVDTLLLQPKTMLKGVLEKRGEVWIHLKNDPARVPVMVTFKTPFGPIVGILKSDTERV